MCSKKAGNLRELCRINQMGRCQRKIFRFNNLRGHEGQLFKNVMGYIQKYIAGHILGIL
jgi:hypothetical protein